MSRAQRVDYQRHMTGLVRQRASNNLLPYLGTTKNVALPMVIAGRRERDKWVWELLGLLDVLGCADRCPARLSDGQQ